MDLRYILKRKKNPLSRWKLSRRAELAVSVLERYGAAGAFSVLDIGACDGAMLARVKDRFPSAECVGVEPEESFLACQADRRVLLLRGRGEALDFPDKSFDFVIISSVLEHVENARAMMAEVLRVLRPGGKLMLLTVLPAYERITVGTGFKKNDHFRNYSGAEAAGFLASCGFRVLERRFLWLLLYNLTVAAKPS